MTELTVDIPCPWLDGPVEVEVGRLHQVIVAELRPMRIAPYEETILALYRRDNIWYPIWSRKNDLMEFRLWIGGPNGRAKSRNFIGWMPMPKYIPKLKNEGC